MKYLSIVGARPQFIKAAALSHAAARRDGLIEVLVHTGQHYDDNLSQIFFKDLDIHTPHYQLNIGSGSHAYQTGRMMEAIEKVIVTERPDWVVVFGDTNTTLAGALTAAKLHVPVAHVEAGLRSFNRRMPEEVNRVLTDHVSDLLFAPTETAVANLRHEGITPENILMCGDVMFDAAIFYSEKARNESTILSEQGLIDKPYILATLHRAENTDDEDRLGCIIQGLCEISDQFTVLMPIHPRTRKVLQQHGQYESVQKRLRLIDPVGYLDMLMLQRSALLIATDSGGMQKEAFFARVPCVTLRDETEWIELVDLGWNRIVPPVNALAIVRSVMKFIEDGAPSVYPDDLYGGGHASDRICQALMDYHHGLPASASSRQKPPHPLI